MQSMYSKTLEYKERPELEVIFEALPEFDHPKYHFEFEDDINFALVEDSCRWFTAKITIKYKECPTLEADTYLGCCSYKSFDEFLEENSSDMIAEALSELESKVLDVKSFVNKL